MNARSRVKCALPRRRGKKSQQDISNEFPCFRCGVCCSKYHVHITLSEAHRIADDLGITWDEWQEKYVEQRWPGSESYLLRRREDGTCVFLDKVAGSKICRCRIHPFRPSSCREWNPGPYRLECQEGLKLFWELTVSKEGKIQGTKEKIADFHAFLKLLEQSDNPGSQCSI